MSVDVGGERVLWNAKSAPACTGTRKQGNAMPGWMHAPVSEVYSKWLALPTEWTAEQRETFIALWVDRLEDEAADLSIDIREESLRAWRADHGRQPDFFTSVRITETAMQTAREAVVRERLYDRIPLDENGDAIPPEPVSGVPWDKRWMDPRYRVREPSEAIEERAREVWPEHSSMFRVVAARLLTARAEEGRPVPRTRRDQLAHDLVPEINEMLCRMKRPPE
jgi:hypothetical protein